MMVDGLSGLFGELEPRHSTGLPLTDGGPIVSTAVWCPILGPEGVARVIIGIQRAAATRLFTTSDTALPESRTRPCRSTGRKTGPDAMPDLSSHSPRARTGHHLVRPCGIPTSRPRPSSSVSPRMMPRRTDCAKPDCQSALKIEPGRSSPGRRTFRHSSCSTPRPQPTIVPTSFMTSGRDPAVQGGEQDLVSVNRDLPRSGESRQTSTDDGDLVL
jgi:hypothetical protein